MARLTVLMPVYNAAPFLRRAIESVLDQSFRDFVLLVVDDGSTDGSGAIAAACAAADGRVRLEHLAHGGLIATLNHALDAIDSELIARADADDVNRPDRLARQVARLDAEPEVGVCGSWMRSIPDGRLWTVPERWDELHAMLPFGCPLYHPTTVMRRAWLERGRCRYDPAFDHAEDYDLWERAAAHTRFANVAAPLLRYRCHPRQVSTAHAAAQQERSRRIRHRQIVALGIDPTADELAVHEAVVAAACGRSPERLEQARRWLERLREANRIAGRYPEPAFTRGLALRWYRNCAEGVVCGAPVAAAFACSPLAGALPDRRWRAARLRALRALPARVSRGLAQLLAR